MNFVEFFNQIDYIFGEDIDEKDVEMAYRIGKKHDISILSDKEIYCIAKSGNDVVGAVWTTFMSGEFSFDVVVKEDYQGKGIGKKLVDIAIQEYESSKEAFGDEAIIRAYVVNPSMEKLLLNKGFEVENRMPGQVTMVRK